MRSPSHRIYWTGLLGSLFLLLFAFPRLRTHPQEFVPQYSEHFAYIDQLTKLVRHPGARAEPEWLSPPGRYAFFAYAVLNLPVYLALRIEQRHPLLRENLPSEFRRPRWSLAIYLRELWRSDFRVLTTAAFLTALWWGLVACLSALRVSSRRAAAVADA